MWQRIGVLICLLENDPAFYAPFAGAHCPAEEVLQVSVHHPYQRAICRNDIGSEHATK